MRNIKTTISLLLFLMLSSQLVAQNGSTLTNDTVYFKYDKARKVITIIKVLRKGKLSFEFGFDTSDINNNKSKKALTELKRENGNDVFSKRPTDTSVSFYMSRDDSITAHCEYFTDEIKKVTFYKANNVASELTDTQVCVRFEIIDPTRKGTSTGGSTDQQSNNNGVIWVIFFIVVLLLAGIIIVFLSRRKRKDQTSLPAPEGGKPIPGMKIVRSQTQNRTVGLEHVREHNEEYSLLDMQNQFDDTAIHRIFLHHTVIKKTYDFFKTFLESANRTPETGCFFIGCWEYADESHKTYNISVEDIVEPGDDIEPDEYSFNFGYKIGGYLDMKVRNMREKTGRDYVHTVWMHSHPGIGLFLSSQDLVVQDLLKNKKEPGRLTAFVIDTNSANWDLAVFTSKVNGEMNNKSDMKHTYSLDELYEWSRKVKKQFSNEERNWDNYLKIELNGKGGNGFSALYMSGKAINQMEEATYVTSNANNVKFLSGNADTPGNWCCIEECNQKNDSIIGILIIDSESSYETIFTKYEDSIWDSLIIMVYRSDEEIWISSRKDLNEQYNGSEKMTQYTMGQMREWIRRKRIP